MEGSVPLKSDAMQFKMAYSVRYSFVLHPSFILIFNEDLVIF